MKFQVRKSLVTDNGKVFNVGNEIGFTMSELETDYHSHVIGRISEISDSYMRLVDVEINKFDKATGITVWYSDIDADSCREVYKEEAD